MWIVKLGCYLSLLMVVTGLPLPPKSYLSLRNSIIEEEDSRSFGGALALRGDEIPANECLMRAKFKEVDDGFEHPKHFLPARNFFEVRDQIERSEVFEIIRKMPKGAVLHAHTIAMTSFDNLIRDILVMPNLFVCYNEQGSIRLRFFELPDRTCDWKLVKDSLARDPNVLLQIQNDIAVLRNTSMGAEYSINDIWTTFEHNFDIVRELITYRPAFEKFFTAALQELYDDNVMYAEIRDVLLKLHELDGKEYDPIQIASIYKQIIDRFVKEHPDFIGAKIIYSPYRRVSQEQFDSDVNIFRQLKRAFPDLIIGFDLIGQEDKGRPLIDFAEKLESLGKETPFFFHAGETDWYGHSTDENLIDAVALNTRRIGHGYALLKHPKLMQIVKERNIAIEVNPISNQVLGLVKDLRNHPASYLFAENFPVVVSNDDPSFWGASGLSHDFYEAFVGIMSREADLRALKQLAFNSIIYNEMTGEERRRALHVWEREWDKFVQDLKRSCH